MANKAKIGASIVLDGEKELIRGEHSLTGCKHKCLRLIVQYSRTKNICMRRKTLLMLKYDTGEK